MKRLFMGALVALAMLTTPACSDPNVEATRALESYGFTNITLETALWFTGCSDSDAWARKFTATNPQGRKVHGVACGSFTFKGVTVRF
jgi:hypothetical protein